MKRLSTALLGLALLPALALAQAPASSEVPAKETQAASGNSGDAQQTAPTTPPPTSSSATAPAAPNLTPTTTAPTVSKKKSALANAVQARTPEEQANQSGFQFIVALDHYLGAGTFVDAKYYSYLAAFLTVVPQYLFGIGKQRLVASVTARLAYEYTMPDAETGRKVGFSDTRIGLSAPAIFRDNAFTGIAFSPNIGLTLPTSPESWNAGMITALSAGVTMSRSVKVVDFRLQLGGSRSFYTSAQSGVRASDARDENGNLYVTCRTGEPVCGFSSMNPAWSFNIGGQVQWRATGSLLFYVGYTFIKSWRHGATYSQDEFTPKALDENGNAVADVGLGQMDRTSAFLGASYQLNEHYSIDLGVSNVQTPLTPTGQVRFPFLSFGTWADNATSLYFTLTAAY
ncbi:MAG: hypothetical protein IT380_12860 [Myxococcales bacterium]|nr:hypothetical protein [Myxococcales bacterium]